MSFLLPQTENPSGPTVVGPEKKPERKSAMYGFVAQILPDKGDGPPAFESHVELTYPYIVCPESLGGCDCPLDPWAKKPRFIYVEPGGIFDGRLTGIEPAPSANYRDLWVRNVCRVSEVVPDFSCYAILTPDGLWLESPEPEARDLIIDPPGIPSVAEPPTPTQQAWRALCADILARYEGCYVLGAEAILDFTTSPRRCAFPLPEEYYSNPPAISGA